MRKYFLITSVLLTMGCLVSHGEPAANQLGGGLSLSSSGDEDCAIWLCLPYQFSQGCGDAEDRLYERLKSGLEPLPPYNQCSSGTLGGEGSFELAHEVVESCDVGFTLITTTPMPEEDEDLDVATEGENSETIDEDVPMDETMITEGEVTDPIAEETDDDVAGVTVITRSCQKCPETEAENGVCEEVEPTYTRRLQSITVSISGETYPPYHVK